MLLWSYKVDSPVYVMKAYRGSGAAAPFILNLGTRRSCVFNFRPAALPPGKNNDTNWIGSLGGTKYTIWEVLKKKIILAVKEIRTSDCSAGRRFILYGWVLYMTMKLVFRQSDKMSDTYSDNIEKFPPI